MRRGALAPIALLLACAAGAACTHTAPFRDAEGNVLPTSIAVMEDVPLGGLAQRVWVRGADTRSPILLLLHGGPGAAESALFRHYDAELERHFLVVYWEQRGAGRSFRREVRDESMTIAQLTADLAELVELVTRRFGAERVVLLAHSWGTVLGTLYAAQRPERVAAYVGIGQMADVRAAEAMSYAYAVEEAERRGHAGALEALREIGPPPHDVDAMLVSRKWVERFGGSFHGGLSTGRLILAALGTDEASLVDLWKFGRGNAYSLERLWPEIRRLDLPARVPSLRVPVFFLLGRYDQQVPARVAAAYFERLDAPCKRLVWFEGSAHNPPFEEPEAFVRTMVGGVRPVALDPGACASTMRAARRGPARATAARYARGAPASAPAPVAPSASTTRAR